MFLRNATAALTAIAALGSITACFAGQAPDSQANSVSTILVPDPAKDSPYMITANGVSVPVEKAGAIQGAYYARFRFSGRVRVKISIRSRPKAKLLLKPECLKTDFEVEGNSISFGVSEPRPRIITSEADGENLWPLLLFPEEEGSVSVRTGCPVYDVKARITSFGVQTADIQKVLDDCASTSGGGVVYFAPGIYRTGTIRIRDNTTVYLAPGTVILGSEDPADYPVDPGRKEQGTHGPVCSFSRLIMFDHCRNSELIGDGVIDGRGHILRNKHKRHIQLIDVTGSRNIRIENVVLRDSSEWTLHILGSERVRVNNLKIINDWGVANTDGIDPDGSRDVFIRRYFGYCGDDAVAVKTTGNSDLLKPAINIHVEDSMVMTRKTSYKIGTETYADISDVVFSGCEAVDSSRGIGLWVRDGGRVSDVTFRDMVLDLREIPGEGMSGEPIRATIENRNGIGSLKHVLFERIRSISPYRCILAGMPASNLESLDFRNCSFAVKPREQKMGENPVIFLSNARGCSFDGIHVKWPRNDKANWNGFISQESCKNVVLKHLEESE